MAVKKITLTEDHLRLIEGLKFERFNFDDKEKISELKKMALSLELKPNPDKAVKDANYYILNNIRDFDSPQRFGWGLDQWNLFGGTYVLEDVALLIGKYEEYIKGTEEDPEGRRFDKELEDYMWNLYAYICDNMEYILSLLTFYATKGGLTPGTYKCIDYEKNWEKVE